MSELEVWTLGTMILAFLLIIRWLERRHARKMQELDAIRDGTLKLFYKYQGKIQSLDREGE